MNTDETQINIPQHIAIIPDGNRRWAKSKGLPTLEGHRKGAENFEKLINYARKAGVKCFTGWSFSTENWRRSQEEVGYLFNLLRDYIKNYKIKFLEEQIRFVHLGRKDRIPEDVVKEIIATEEATKQYDAFTVAIAMDYGGHDEIVRAVQKLNDLKKTISIENIEQNLDTNVLPKLDLIIRPGGEFRLSGFMAWQSEYAEFYFTNLLFPDFGPEELQKAIDSFTKRERRFGGDSKKY